MTSPQYGVLAALATRPRIAQHELGKLASLDKSSTADVVARLVRKMWITTTPDPDDRRQSLLSLAPAAEVALRYLTPHAQRVQDKLLHRIDAELQRLFVAALGTIARIDTGGFLLDEPRPANVLDLRETPGHLIRRAQQVHTAIWATVVGREITGPQYAAVHVLEREPGINQRQLGERAALDKSTAADLIARLVRRGWVLRDRDPDDARGKVLRLSPSGLQAVDAVDPLVAAVQEELVSPLAASERTRFLTALAQLAYGDTGSSLDR